MRLLTDLVVKRVDDIVRVENQDEDHRGRHVATKPAPLLAGHRDVDEDPEDEARPELVERLDVERADRRVELATHPELTGDQATGQGKVKS